ncbi:MAG: acetate kinase, partial [bacterium]|nr:acetate kinase [bacterium]
MKILIANPGSTSYKCKLFDMQILKPLFQIAIERIGEQQGVYHYQFDDSDERSITQQIPDYFAAVNISIQALEQKYALEEISAIGFKVVLAKNVTGCVELTDDVLSAMREYLPLAPVHNQIYLTAISCFQKIVADIPLVGLFETAFHADIPPEAYLYGIPFEFYEKYGIRKYGFHGASHRYIAEYVTDCYGQNSEQLKIISCHLGGSSSVCAIRNGKSIDTTMGMSPQCGLLNAKRVGDLDSFALLYLMEKQDLTIPATRELLIQRSGVVGISGLSGDFRDIEQAMNRGHQQARLAFNTFAYVVKRYIGQYLAIMN